MKNKAVKTMFNFLPAIIWMAVIFYFSSVPGLGYPGFSFWKYAERKAAHVGEYFWLFIFLFYGLRSSFGRSLKNKDYYYWAIFLSLIYAVSDEIHQVFVVGREGKITDVGFDATGIVLGVLFLFLFIKKRKNISQ